MPSHRFFVLALLLAAALSGTAARAAGTAPQPLPLPRFQIDHTELSVSGLSSGAFMAAQLQVPTPPPSRVPASSPVVRTTAPQATWPTPASAWAR